MTMVPRYHAARDGLDAGIGQRPGPVLGSNNGGRARPTSSGVGALRSLRSSGISCEIRPTPQRCTLTLIPDSSSWGLLAPVHRTPRPRTDKGGP